jgi:hypothetical protein
MAKSWTSMPLSEKVDLLREELTSCRNELRQLRVFLHDVKSRADRLEGSVHARNPRWRDHTNACGPH